MHGDRRYCGGPAHQTRIIAIANQKGGVGKTTTTVNLGAELAALGRRVLLVDLDPQAAATYSLGIDPEASTLPYIMSWCAAKADHRHHLPDAGRRHGLVPSNLDLAAAELDLFRNYTRERVLKRRAGARWSIDYDYILIDCPPSLTLLTVNAFVAATEVLIPLQTHLLSLRGVQPAAVHRQRSGAAEPRHQGVGHPADHVRLAQQPEQRDSGEYRAGVFGPGLQVGDPLWGGGGGGAGAGGADPALRAQFAGGPLLPGTRRRDRRRRGRGAERASPQNAGGTRCAGPQERRTARPEREAQA